MSGGFIKDVGPSGISGKLKSNVDFHCRRCLRKVLSKRYQQREIEIEPNVKLECGEASYRGKRPTISERG